MVSEDFKIRIRKLALPLNCGVGFQLCVLYRILNPTLGSQNLLF